MDVIISVRMVPFEPSENYTFRIFCANAKVMPILHRGRIAWLVESSLRNANVGRKRPR